MQLNCIMSICRKHLATINKTIRQILITYNTQKIVEHLVRAYVAQQVAHSLGKIKNSKFYHLKNNKILLKN